MSLPQGFTDGALRAIAAIIPEAGGLVSWLEYNENKAIALVGVVWEAIKAGRAAIDAVQAECPELAQAIRNLVDATNKNAPSPPSPAQVSAQYENATRSCFGLHRMTPEEERVWMERATPPDDSQAGSG